ncbi:MAG: gliding motility protein GldN [Bacteroidales bacterium]
MNRFGLIILLALPMCFLGKTEVKAQAMEQQFQNESIKERVPLPLPSVSEADIRWRRTFWRIIDVREKMNQRLYFPLERTEGRNSLINVILNGIKTGELIAYDARTSGDDFKKPMTLDEVNAQLGSGSQVIEKTNFETGETERVTIEGAARTDEIYQYMIKEVWYLDKRTSMFRCRVVGICPIREFYRDGAEETPENIQRTLVCWIHYPEARALLARSEVFNEDNQAAPFSYDDLFINRYFSSYIVKEASALDRYVWDYKSGQDAMRESEEIETKLFNYEQDLWEY